jgi:hypothetical protein
MSVTVRILDGPQAGASCEVPEGERVVLGRSGDTDLCVLDSWASRSHCAITVSDDGVLLEDLRSKNGTYVNGERVEQASLSNGAIFQIGTTSLEVIRRPTVLAAAAEEPVAVEGRRRNWLALAAAVLVAGLAYGGYRFFGGGGSERNGGGDGQQARASAAAGQSQAAMTRGAPSGVPVSFTSKPSGAMVFIDDEFRDVTPLRNYRVAPGEHTLRIQKAGYRVHRGRFTVGAESGEPVHVSLQLAERGTLDIRSTPDGATVYLDGERRGRTPLRIDDLEPQTYTVRLTKQNFVEWQQDVTVKASDTTVIEPELGHREIGFYLAKLKDDPNNVSYHAEVAHLYLLEHKLEACMDHLDKALEVSYYGNDTSEPKAYRSRLIWLIQKIYFQDHFAYGDDAFVVKTRSAVDRMLARVAARHPDSSAIPSLARKLYKKAGTPERMLVIYLKVAEANPSDPGHLGRLLAALRKSGNEERAEKLLEKTVATLPDDYHRPLFVGRFYLAAAKQDVPDARQKAIQSLNAALEQCPDQAQKAVIRKLLGQATR